MKFNFWTQDPRIVKIDDNNQEKVVDDSKVEDVVDSTSAADLQAADVNPKAVMMDNLMREINAVLMSQQND